MVILHFFQPDKIEETEKPKESTEKTPEKPKEKADSAEVKSGFGDLLAKQKSNATEPDTNQSKSAEEPKVIITGLPTENTILQ